jgi:hypothetical protein
MSVMPNHHAMKAYGGVEVGIQVVTVDFVFMERYSTRIGKIL